MTNSVTNNEILSYVVSHIIVTVMNVTVPRFLTNL